MSVALDAAAVSDLAGKGSGPVLTPDDAGYDEARRVHNGLIDRRPAVIARCHGAADIAAALALAREAGLEVSVRGGGHNVAGRAVLDGALMIDLSLMKAVDVDPDAQDRLARRAACSGASSTRGDRGARPRHHRRRDLDDRDRRAHARRRARLADGEARPRGRQPASPSSS